MKIFILLCVLLPVALANQKVIGGSDAANGAWPWQVSHRNGGSHSCGACLIRANWALSAAHCVGGAVGLYVMIFGTNQRSCPGNACEQRNVDRVTRHANFQNSGAVGFPNDVAVIHWASPLAEVAGRIQYVNMARTADQVGRLCYISGWGRMSSNGALPENLQEARIDLLTTSECADMCRPTPVTDNQVCIFDRATQARGACNGDSGGPLVCQLGSGQWELVGATSWGRTGCGTTFPSVYTRVSAYYDWVITNIGE